MNLMASDSRGRSAVVAFEVRITPLDEYPPVFTKSRYTFQVPLPIFFKKITQIPINSAIGSKIGAVRAVDADGGIHGIVKYGIEGEYRLVAIDAKTGEVKNTIFIIILIQITLRRALTNRQNLTIEQVTVVAYSSQNKRTRATVYLEVGQLYLFFNFSKNKTNWYA